MVNIIINDNGNSKNNTEDIILYEGLDELKELLTNLNDENISLKSLVESLQQTISTLNNEILILRKDIETIKKITSTNNKQVTSKTIVTPTSKTKSDKKTEKTSKNKGRGRRRRDNDLYEPNKHVKTDWKNLKLKDDGKIINYGQKEFTLPVTLNELLYIKECSENGFTFKEANQLMKTFHIKPGTFGKLIHNLRYTDNFKEVFDKYESNLSKAKFSITNNYLKINNKKTNISQNTAYEWVQMMANAPRKQEKILELQYANTDMDKDIIRIVCDSYNNNRLVGLLKTKSGKSFVENNPSKRRNLIANGGLL